MALDDVTVGIPTCDDDPKVLALALDALAAEPLTRPPLVVDMSRTEAIRGLAARRSEAVRYVSARGSSGTAESRNRIVELADTRFVLFLDADAVPEPGWAEALRAALASGDDVGLAGARILPAWPRLPPPLFTTTIASELLGMLDLGPEPCDLPRVMGTSYALDRERLPAAEPFRTSLGRRPGVLLAWEEVQLSLDVLAAGSRIRYAPDAVVRHHVRPERLSWRWMLRRVHVAGRETHLRPERLEPFPRALGAADRAFQLVTAPAHVAGRLRGLRA